MSKRRVVVTGLGMLSPLGASVKTSWEGLTAGHSGIAPIAAFDADSFPVRFGGAVPDFDMSSYLPAKEARRMDGFIQWGSPRAFKPFVILVLRTLTRIYRE